MKNLFTILLAALLVVSLASCGSEKGNADETGSLDIESQEGFSDISEYSVEQTEDGEQTWGNITAVVPAGFTMTHGTVGDYENENSVSIYETANMLKYCYIFVQSEEEIDASITSTKENFASSYDITDITDFTTDTATWTGISYGEGDMVFTYLKGQIGEKFVQVQMCGMERDSEVALKILNSIKVK